MERVTVSDAGLAGVAKAYAAPPRLGRPGEPTLLLTEGYPGSGKSTWAKQQEGWTVVNRDIIRAQVVAKYAEDKKRLPADPRELEAEISAAELTYIEEQLARGNSVIKDALNLDPAHRTPYERIAAKLTASVRVQKFDTPIWECYRRNLERREAREKQGLGHVPDKALVFLWKMYERKLWDRELDARLGRFAAAHDSLVGARIAALHQLEDDMQAAGELTVPPSWQQYASEYPNVRPETFLLLEADQKVERRLPVEGRLPGEGEPGRAGCPKFG